MRSRGLAGRSRSGAVTRQVASADRVCEVRAVERSKGDVMAERSLFIGFGTPVRGREERAVAVFNEFVGLFGRLAADGRIEGMDVTLLDPHGGDLGGFFMVHGTVEQCAALPNDEEFRRAMIDASLIVENFGVVPALSGEAVGPEMALYSEAVAKVPQSA
jgi:hypothetical protein